MPTFIRLVDHDSAERKALEFFNKMNRHNVNQTDFMKIPGFPLAYWVSQSVINAFKLKISIAEYSPAQVGMQTSNNDKYIRLWWEINYNLFKDSNNLWYLPYIKGGPFRRWYGNNYYLLSYHNDSNYLRKQKNATVLGIEYLNKRKVTWTDIASNLFNARFGLKNSFYDISGHCCFPKSAEDQLNVLAYMNTKIFQYVIDFLNPTLHYQVGDVNKIPIIELDNLSSVQDAISISKADWDLREISWDFQRSPMLADYMVFPTKHEYVENIVDWRWQSAFINSLVVNIPLKVEAYKKTWTVLFQNLHGIEYELNKRAIASYNLKDELDSHVSYSDITILQEELIESARKEGRIEFDEGVITQQFVSYGVGCLMGRYSVEKDGLILADAGSTLDDFELKSPEARFLPDPDGILPLTDEDDFPDDLPTAFKGWLRFISGDHYDDNLRWIEDRLGKDLRSYFDRDFYKEHIKRYKSRPIYWMVSSPSGAFRALIYLHRYTKDTVGKVLNDYVRPYRTKLEQKSRGLEAVIDSGSSSVGEKIKAKKRLAQLEKYKVEIEAWEKEKLYPLALKRVELDLDDGVKVNYRKLEGILEPVKQLEAKEEDE